MRAYLEITHPSQKRCCGVAQGVGPEFKPQYRKQTNNNKRELQASLGYIHNKNLSKKNNQTNPQTTTKTLCYRVEGMAQVLQGMPSPGLKPWNHQEKKSAYKLYLK
jgi:hypothetical protein